MKVVKIGEAKNNFSRYLKYVQSGGRVRIYDRNRPVADLVPIEPSGSGEDDDWWLILESLAKRGVLKLGQRRPKHRFGPLPKDPGGLAVKALLEERRSGR